jgi:hypothetical protein
VSGSGAVVCSWFLLFAAIIAAFRQKFHLSSCPDFRDRLIQTTHLSSAGISLMTTLPVLCVGAFAPAAPALARRFGAERSILGLMIVLAIGTALRGLAVISALAAGTIMAGAAIAIINVLLPGLIKRDFPHRTGLMSGLYTMDSMWWRGRCRRADGADPGTRGRVMAHGARRVGNPGAGGRVVVGTAGASAATASPLRWGRDFRPLPMPARLVRNFVQGCVYRKLKSDHSGDEVRPEWRVNE